MSAVRLGLLTPLSGVVTLVAVLHGLVGLAVLGTTLVVLLMARAVWTGRARDRFGARRRTTAATGDLP